MDILTHALSGIAFGTVISGFSKCKLKNQIGFIAIGGFGGVLPDIDAISLWSKFDSIFGRLFGLSNTGKYIYSAKFWYSHHGFMHSLASSIFFGLLFGLIIYLVQSRFKLFRLKMLIKSFEDNKLYIVVFIFGFILHLVGDLPTPSSSWCGIRLFWPSNYYIGGTGEIWWWNNYDIFLIALSVIITNIIAIFIGRLVKIKVLMITISIFLIGLIMIIYQVKTRTFDFNYDGHFKKFDFCEHKSKEIQKQILGDKLYNVMEGFDNKLKINF